MFSSPESTGWESTNLVGLPSSASIDLNNSLIKKITMKSFFTSKRSKAILGIGLIAIGIGAISKKFITYPTGGCMKGTQELTLKKGIKKLII